MDRGPDEPERALHSADGVATRAGLRQQGVSDDRIRWAVSRRRWQLVLPGVVLLSPSPPTRRQQLVAATLLGGRGAVVAGPSAARFHGVRGIPGTGTVHVRTPRTRRRRRHAFADIRPTWLEDDGIVHGELVSFSSVARSVVDAAVWSPSQEDATAWTIEAVQRDLVTLADLESWVHRLNRRWGRRAREALRVAESGAWSLPEAELLSLLGRSRLLPEPWPNPPLVDALGAALVTPDAWFDDVALAVMMHSRQFHDGRGRFDATVVDDGELSSRGVVVVGVTPASMRADPPSVLDRVERAYRWAASRPRPDVRAARRTGLRSTTGDAP
ncbi:hypothetical protein KC207_10755 [Phycicoccus sp. BSK3Z-2]|uniref:Uncharacterized protein n=1 Tax=Phycicoccus avicenniae TaxID=2828860 RepID=A0A941D804_9MICO|nr:hypothetical protein [Phycicoccus avicenniae]MBR7743769.1 hypothetical protein [Phycicoccus avicenniae]